MQDGWFAQADRLRLELVISNQKRQSRAHVEVILVCPSCFSFREPLLGVLGGALCLFCSEWREAFLISGGYGMGDPMAPSDSEGNSEGGGSARRIASRLPCAGPSFHYSIIPFFHSLMLSSVSCLLLPHITPCFVYTSPPNLLLPLCHTPSSLLPDS